MSIWQVLNFIKSFLGQCPILTIPGSVGISFFYFILFMGVLVCHSSVNLFTKVHVMQSMVARFALFKAFSLILRIYMYLVCLNVISHLNFKALKTDDCRWFNVHTFYLCLNLLKCYRFFLVNIIENASNLHYP